jgi:hypothetical protein
MGKERKRELKVIHVHFKQTDTHDYFGSIVAVYESYSHEELGIRYNTLKNYKLPYENKKVVVRQGVLKTKTTSK